MKPIIQLFIPQLFEPLKLWKQDLGYEVNLPVIESLLSRFEVVENNKSSSLEASLFNELGLTETQELPVAHYRFGSNNNSEITKKKHYICSDPIHLEAGMNDVTLTEIINDLTEGETEEILKELNQHFSQDGLEFVKDSNQHIYLTLPEKEDVKTTPLSSVLRKNITDFQPYSEDRNWRVIQNESQMILHNSEVNNQREIAGLPTVNSLWFWGGGVPLIESSTNKNQNVSEVLYKYESAINPARIIANASGCRFSLLQDEIPVFKQGKTLVILDNLYLPAINDNLDLYQQGLTVLEKTISTFKQAWLKGEVDLLIDSCDGRILKPIKPKAWKFWEKSLFPSLLQ